MGSLAAIRRLGLLLGLAAALWLATAALGHYVLGAFPSFGDAAWSGLRHLLDPGALADDDSAAERAVGLTQLLVGLVFIVGVLIAVLEDAVAGSLRRLAEGDPRVGWSGHVVIVGWNPLVPAVITEYAQGPDSSSPVAVIIPAGLRAQRPEIEAELSRRSGHLRTHVIAGDPGPSAFERAGLRRARAVVIASGPGSDAGDPDQADLGTIGAGLAVREWLGSAEEPAVFPALMRGRNLDSVERRFPKEWEYVVADRAASGVAGAALERPELTRMLAAGFIREPGPGLVHAVPPDDSLVGRPFSEQADLLESALPVGISRASGELILAPHPSDRLNGGDRLLAVTVPRSGPDPAHEAPADSDHPRVGIAAPPRESRRVLFVGPVAALSALVEELGGRSSVRFELTVQSPENPRFAEWDATANVVLNWRRDVATEPAQLARALEEVSPDAVVIAADPGAYGESADARALLTAFHVARCDGSGAIPILVDLLAGIDTAMAGDDPRIHLLSRSTVLARWIALLLKDPISARATATLVEGRAARLDAAPLSAPDGPVPFRSAYLGLLEGGVVPIGLVGRDGIPVLNPPPTRRLDDGQWVIAIRRPG